MTTSLSAPLAAYLAGPADLATAKSLTYDKAAGLGLVAALAEKKARAHLEALGEVAADKDVKKAARAAAYKLKSQGVAAAPLEKKAGVDLSVVAELDRVAIVSAPGLDGHLWLVLASLPGAGGGELDVRDPERGPRLDAVEDLALGRVRRKHAEIAAASRMQKPLLADAALAVRLIDYAIDDLKDAPRFPYFQAWRDRAVKLGADPATLDARAKLGPSGRPVPRAAIEQLARHPIVGYIAPPGSALDQLERDLGPLVHSSEPITRDDFAAQVNARAQEAANRWSADDAQRARSGKWLDATADVLFASGDADMAQVALALADDVREWNPAGGAHPLIEYAFETNLDFESAWHHREAHTKGEAHHDHE